jgi:hypothetical protein
MAPRSASSSERFPSQPAAANSDMARRPPEREGARTPRSPATRSAIPMRRTIRRSELRQIVPVADTTIASEIGVNADQVSMDLR